MRKLAKRLHILYAFGFILCITGVVYLAEAYIKYLSDWDRLTCLLLGVGMFAFLGKYFDDTGR